MKTSSFAAMTLFLISGIGLCRANLGDTEAQCVARYGAELSTQDDVGYRQVGDKAVIFRAKTASASLDIKVIFLHGLSCHESISNADSAQGLTEAQMKALLDAQSATFKWRKRNTEYRTYQIAETYAVENWLRSDGATATFSMSGKAASGELSGELEISTKLYTDAQHFYDKENGDAQ